MVTTSPELTGCVPCTARPLTLVPLWLPRSRMMISPPSQTISAWRREQATSAVRIWASLARPIKRTPATGSGTSDEVPLSSTSA